MSHRAPLLLAKLRKLYPHPTWGLFPEVPSGVGREALECLRIVDGLAVLTEETDRWVFTRCPVSTCRGAA